MEICLVDPSRRKKLIIDLKHAPAQGDFIRLLDRCFKVSAVFHDVDSRGRLTPRAAIKDLLR